MTRVLRFDKTVAEAVENFSARATSSVHLGGGSGESHAYVLHFAASGEIGEHETGFGQLFIVVDDEGWVRSGSDHHEVGPGDAVFLPRGATHAKGSKSGMTAVMVQMFDLEPASPAREEQIRDPARWPAGLNAAQACAQTKVGGFALR